jgi:ATP-dependent 26S proteasome regulatory subunit
MTTIEKPEATDAPTSSDLEATTLQAKLRSRSPLIIVITPEESRVKPYVFEAAASVKYETRFYDIAQGFTDLSGKLIMGDRGQGNVEEAFAAIKENKSRCVWVMLDMIPWLKEPVGLINQRALRNLIEYLPKQPGPRAQTIVLITSNPDIPPEIASDATIVNWPMPDRAEMGRILDDACAPILSTDKTTPEFTATEVKEWKAIQAGVRKSITGVDRSAAIDASIGLTQQEAASCFATSLVMELRIDPVLIAQEKKRVIAANPALEWIDPPGNFETCVGGNENILAHIRERRLAFSDEAREYRLDTPLGILLVGISGCGKSLIAKCTGAEWGVPVIRVDLGALKSKFVGESEQNLRKALAIIEALGWCVVWLDEVEKALEGATSGSADGGVSADVLGTVLTWMQDRPGQAYVIATANDASKLPPEFMRKGRFDEVFFVDLPDYGKADYYPERTGVLKAALRKRGRDAATLGIDCQAVAEATEMFTGAEIDALIPDAMFVAFADDKREITTADLVNAAKGVVPLAKTKEDDIEALRKEWAGRAKPASKSDSAPVVRVKSSGTRQLDL